ncbi:MAG: hypothetical protein EOO40_04310 [Deltaproteobacteria bacterium]|nr:MAG: hypothetical protein EOO40_04310 [Deltaproteobacteria bacterium]
MMLGCRQNLALVARRAAGVALWCAVAACGDPCRDLAEAYCNCEPMPERRAACLDKVGAIYEQNKQNKQQDQDAGAAKSCRNLLDGCTCEAVAQGNLQACGLSLQATPPQ